MTMNNNDEAMFQKNDNNLQHCERLNHTISNENLKHFETLNQIDVSHKIEKKKSGSVELTYLSWSWAWGELKKKYPCAIYEVQKFNGLPYVFDPLTGYMVYTKITIENITHEMWLPVMDGANKAMKDKSYEYTTKFGKKTCEAATMFDINKTMMRCLVKNIAMFGLGLYIFAGEDLPEDYDDHLKNDQKTTSLTKNIEQSKTINLQQEEELLTLLQSCKSITLEIILNNLQVQTLKEIKESVFEKIKAKILMRIEKEQNIIN